VTDPLGFVENEIVLADGRPVCNGLAADPWIRSRVLAPTLAVNEVGLPRYRLVYLELPRGHWKTGGAAAVATAEAALHPSTDVVIGAADTDQARINLENVLGYLDRNESLGALFHARRDEIITDRGSRIRIVSSDAPSAYGLGGTHRRFRIVCDELTTWKSDALWVALASASGKTPDAQTIVLSNAGFDSVTSWQWEVRETARTAEWGYLYAPDGVIASWITDQWVEQMRALLPGAAFDRLIGNVWTDAAGDFVDREQWRACVDDRLRPGTGGSSRHFAGLDLGLTHDRSVLTIVHWDDTRSCSTRCSSGREAAPSRSRSSPSSAPCSTPLIGTQAWRSTATPGNSGEASSGCAEPSGSRSSPSPGRQFRSCRARC